MKYFVKAKPSSKNPFIVQKDATHFEIAVKEPPIDGKANEAVEKALAEYLDRPPSEVRVMKGATSKNKVVEVG